MILAQLSGNAAQPLEGRLRAAIAASGAEAAVALRSLDGRIEVLIDGDRPYHAASTMKVPVMIELFAQARAGTLSLDDELPITNGFRSIADGSLYSLDETDDSERELYRAIGRTRSLRELCRLMIVASSNLATNLLIERLGVDRIRSTVARLGADGMQVLRGVEDGKAFAQGRNNTTTARGLMVLFDRLARGTAIDPAADAEMVEILKAQQFTDGIPAGLPRGIAVAHKTGNITRIHHDAGIVVAPRPYVLVVLVRGVDDREVSGALIAEISRLAYEALSAAP